MPVYDINSYQGLWVQLLDHGYEDGLNAIRVASWKNTIGKVAFEAGDYGLACDRYAMTIDFVKNYTKYAVYLKSIDRRDQLKCRLDMQSIIARLGVVGSRVKAGQWLEAKIELQGLFLAFDPLPYLKEYEPYLLELENYIMWKISLDEAKRKKAKQ